MQSISRVQKMKKDELQATYDAMMNQQKTTDEDWNLMV